MPAAGELAVDDCHDVFVTEGDDKNGDVPGWIVDNELIDVH